MDDNKNYHAWAHRQYFVSKYDAWGDEFHFVDRMLDVDPQNNSAWNHRMFVLQHGEILDTMELIQAEILVVQKYLGQSPYNESPWAYVWGLRKITGVTLEMLRPMLQFARELLTSLVPGCPTALGFVADYLEATTRAFHAIGESANSAATGKKTIEVYSSLCEFDPVHMEYWSHRAARLSSVILGPTTH